ncbi:MICAL-like protein 1 isoform X2 [Orussus abietinus]|uniref:MICAL-like protein 1 isoform X2 n=1 Tax=Orussus abietinus TaxID=222816 RepID=UPI000625F8AE|nr:MICAL-like protein 1 isoform X2 [Orussus abietinus]
MNKISHLLSLPYSLTIWHRFSGQSRAASAMFVQFRDFDSLHKDDVYGNNELAFRVAQQHLGIPALLDAEDMASCTVPDRLSILTYLAQFYQTFGASSPSRLATNRPTEMPDGRIAPVPTSPPPKTDQRVAMRRDACSICGLPVFLAEKLVISRTVYHRTCFRCARCNNQLTLGNYYETEDGQYCCETCPDEEKASSDPIAGTTRRVPKILDHPASSEVRMSLSDEEKSERRTVTSKDPEKSEKLDFWVRKQSNGASQTAKSRLNFMTDYLLSGEKDEISVVRVPPSFADDGSNLQRDSPLTASSDSISSLTASREDIAEEYQVTENGRVPTSGCASDGTFWNRIGKANTDSDRSAPVEQLRNESKAQDGDNGAGSGDSWKGSNEGDVKKERGKPQKNETGNGDADSDLGTPNGMRRNQTREWDIKNKRSALDDTPKENVDSSVNNYLETNVNGTQSDNQLLPAISTPDASRVELVFKKSTKDAPKITESKDKGEGNLSLVQRRLKMFESQGDKKAERTSRIVDAARVTECGAEDVTDRGTSEQQPSALGQSLASSNLSEQKESKSLEKVPVDSPRIPENTLELPGWRESVTRLADVHPLKAPESPSGITKRAEPSEITPPKLKQRLHSTDNRSGALKNLNTSENYPENLNPFGSDDEDTSEDGTRQRSSLDNSKNTEVSTNPFDETDDEEFIEEVTPPRPAARNRDASQAPTKRRLQAPQINLNPFWSDDEEHDDETVCTDQTVSVPIPKPRSVKQVSETSGYRPKTDLNRSSVYASNNSIASTGSSSTPGGTYRKKKPAPPPPTTQQVFSDEGGSTRISTIPSDDSPLASLPNSSPRTTPRLRKSRLAPPPPTPTSVPCITSATPISGSDESPITNPQEIDADKPKIWDEQKSNKDEANRSKQSVVTVIAEKNDEVHSYVPHPDKSVQGKWKRKKGPAPSRPIPHRRKIKVMSMKDVKLELDEIELQQQGLEKQGVRLEQLIRHKSESGLVTEDSSLSSYVEELVLELFALVNEKNELFRRQAELMLLRRQQRLEEEHAEVEYQIRCLMNQPEATKTDFDKQHEEGLIQRLLEIVERRNQIVECLEMDRRREVEEDLSINRQIGLFVARSKGDLAHNCEHSNRSNKQKKGKVKEKKSKGYKKDVDKDIDEAEAKLKHVNKKKWF